MAASPPAARPPAKAPGRGGLRSPTTWLIILGVAVGAYLLYRRYEASQASTAASTDTTAASDATDYSGEIATLQTEIADLQSSLAQGSGSGGGTTTTTGGGTTTGTGTTTTGTGTTTTGTGTGTKTGTGTAPAAPKVVKPGMPTSVHGAAASATSVKLSWTKVSGATGYRAHATYQGKDTPTVSSSATSVTLTGLTADHTYTCHVLAYNSAGESAETNGPAVKTPKG